MLIETIIIMKSIKFYTTNFIYMHTVHVTCVKKIHPPHHWTALNQPSLLITCPVWICMLQSLQIRLWQDDHYYTKVKAYIITVKMANDIGSSSLRTRPSGHYAKAQWAHMFYWSWARNSQELIDSTTGVVLAPKVQPGPHQVMALSMGWMFCHPSQSQIPILEHQDKVTYSKSQQQDPGGSRTPNPRIRSPIL